MKHLNDTVDLNELFTPRVITSDVLQSIEPIINEKFSYGTEDLNAADLSIMLEGDEGDDV